MAEKKERKIQHWQWVAAILVVYDFFMLNLSFFLALWLRFDCRLANVEPEYLKAYLYFTWIYALLGVLIYRFCGLYHSVWRFASFMELVRIVKAVVITFFLHCIGIIPFVMFFSKEYLVNSYFRMPYSYYFVGIVLQFMLTMGARFSYRFYLLLVERQKRSNGEFHPVMLIGAGSAGRALIREMNRFGAGHDRVSCIIDDDPNKWHRDIDGIPIIGGRDEILKACEKHSIEKIYIAIPSASAGEVRDILSICKETDCALKLLRSMYQVVDEDQISVRDLKDVSIEDLLGRDPIRVDMKEIYDFLNGKIIMITGGGGSIGSELCRQVAKHHPKQLIIFDIYENNAYAIQQELIRDYPELDLVVLIGSVRDSRRIDEVFAKYRPEIVYHAAAHKHVPLMESSPHESIKNNVIGTYKTAYAALKYGCRRFVLISTDKAVNPTNIMGASKRLCEMIVQIFDQAVKAKTTGRICPIGIHKSLLTAGRNGGLDSREMSDGEGGNGNDAVAGQTTVTEFVAVRFGNVLGSNGSVVPLFKEQIAQGGPVTVTHPDIIRYFMTIPEAVSLVLQAGTYAKGGEIFVLDMGSPVKIDQLARNLIRLSGFKPDEDIKIVYTGLRPGEKMYEEKLMDEEGLETTPNHLIHIGHPVLPEADVFLRQIEVLEKMAYDGESDIRKGVAEIVDTYRPEK